MRAAVLAAILAALAAGAAGAAGTSGAAGPARAGAAPAVAPARFELRGTARVETAALPPRDGPVDVLALVAPGDGPGAVLLHLRSRGFGCELRATIARGGELSFQPAQTCAVEVDDDDARGRIEARLRRGRGRLDGGSLRLELAWDLSGALRTRVAVPGAGGFAAWTPEVPVHGSAEGAASSRDDAPSPPPSPRARPRGAP